MILGITGGTGCGKTTLLSLIREQGGLVLDCDEIYHGLLASDPALLASLAQRFPGTVTGGTLDRKKLGAIVFADKQALADLNKLTHSAVRAEVERRLEEAPKLAAIDAIALFESGLDSLCDVTVAVTAPLESRVQRLMARDGIGERYARSRIAAQHDDKWFRERCDAVLTNDGGFPKFYNRCLAFLREWDIIEDTNHSINTEKETDQ